MFSTLFPILTGKKTVAGVLSVFSKAISDLEIVACEQTAEAERHADTVAQAQAAQSAATLEAASAREVMGKMLAIVTPSVSAVAIGLIG